MHGKRKQTADAVSAFWTAHSMRSRAATVQPGEDAVEKVSISSEKSCPHSFNQGRTNTSSFTSKLIPAPHYHVTPCRKLRLRTPDPLPEASYDRPSVDLSSMRQDMDSLQSWKAAASTPLPPAYIRQPDFQHGKRADLRVPSCWSDPVPYPTRHLLPVTPANFYSDFPPSSI